MITKYPVDPLLCAAASAGIDTAEVRRILWALIAPPTYDDFSEILDKFSHVLGAAEDKWSGVLAEMDIALWPAMASTLRPIVETLNFPITPLDARHIGQQGDRGHRQRNALYSALLALPDYHDPLAMSDGERRYVDSCYLLMAHVFVAHYKVLSIPAGTVLLGGYLVKGDTSLEAYEAYAEKKQWPALTISPKNCCLALRALFSGERWAQTMIPEYPLGDQPLQFAQYSGLVFEGPLIRNGASKARLEELEGYVLRYLAQANGFRERHRGHGKYSSSRGSSSKASAETDAQAEAAYRHDICPAEDDAEDDDTDGESFDDDNRFGRDAPPGRTGRPRSASRAPKKHNKPRKGAGNAVGVGSDQGIRNSKFFPFATDCPSPSVLATVDMDGRRRAEAILAELRTMVQSAEPADEQDLCEEALKREVELLVFLLVMLWTNSNIERTQGLRCYLTDTCHDRTALAILMSPAFAGSSAHIRIHVEFPPDAPRRELLRPYDRDRSEYAVLPDGAALGPLLWGFLTVLDGAAAFASRSAAIEVFRQPVEYYSKHIPNLLVQMAEDRLSAVSLSSALYGAIMSWAHKDISAATMITGFLSKKARVQMFYAVRRMVRLQEIYVGTVHYLRNEIGLARSADLGAEPQLNELASLLQVQRSTSPKTVFIPAPDEATYVGINSCPNDQAMRTAVRSLITKVEEIWRLSPSTNWIEAHNLYTYYVVWFFGFVTSARPTRRPVLRVSEIDESNLQGRLQDKGAAKARLVFITRDLLQQLKFYETYVATTRLASCISYPCWFLNDAGAPVPASDEICESILHKVLPGFPTNIHRRWMFNALLDSGCPYVAEWAGHFLTGNRLVGRGATASPTLVGRTILQYVEPIISYLGFRPIQVGL